MTPRRRVELYLLLAAGVGAALLPAAASAGQPLTASAYRAKARPICLTADRASRALPTKGLNRVGAIRAYEALANIGASEIAGLKRLTPPSSIAPLVNVALADKARVLVAVRRAVAKLEAGASTLQAALIIAAAPSDSRIWAQIGLSVCKTK